MNQPDLNSESIRLLAKIYIWRKPLLIVTISAAVLSTIISFLLSPQYKATAIVFPARTFSVSKLLIEQNQGAQEDYMDIGDEDDAEKLLQILNSTEIKLKVANQYNLWDNWRIEKSSPNSLHYLKLKWDDMVSFRRTNYVSIKIEVYDYESSRAAKIANSIVSFADSVKFSMTREVAKQALEIVKEEYETTLVRMNELEDSLQKIRELGVLDYKAEISAYSKSMAKAVAQGNESAINKLQQKLDILKKYGVLYDDLANNIKKYRFKYPVIKGKYDEALVNFNKPLPSNFIVEKAIADDKKDRPIRWLIVLISTSSAFLLAFIYLLATEKFTDIKKKINAHIHSQNL